MNRKWNITAGRVGTNQSRITDQDGKTVADICLVMPSDIALMAAAPELLEVAQALQSLDRAGYAMPGAVACSYSQIMKQLNAIVRRVEGR